MQHNTMQESAENNVILMENNGQDLEDGLNAYLHGHH